MYTKISIEKLSTEHRTEIITIHSEAKDSYSRETKVTVRCCVQGCNETVSKTLRNLFMNKNFGCKIHANVIKGKKIKNTKENLNLDKATSQDDGKRYTYEQLCIMECRPSLFNICNKLKITKYHNLQKNTLIEAIIERQNEIDRLRGIEEYKDDVPQDNNKIVEMNPVSDMIIMESAYSKNTNVMALELTQQLKIQFLEKHYFFEFNNIVWVQAKSIASFLEYKEPSLAIRDIIDVEDKKMFNEFPEKIRSDISSKVCGKGTYNHHNIDPKTIFITSTGMLDLFIRSNLPFARKMKRWLMHDVVPSILSTGTYSLYPSPDVKNDVQILAVAEACPRTTTCYNPKGFPISSMRSAIYILSLPLLNMHKFGYSNNLINRFKQHEYDFGEISIEFVIEAPEVQEIEKRLKNDIRSHGINTVFEIDGRKLKELFEPQYFQRVCEIINGIINNYKKDRFTSTENHDYRMISEKIKLEEETTKQEENKAKQEEHKAKQEEHKAKQEEEKTKQMQCEIELLKLRLQLEELNRKRKLEEIN